MVPRYNLLLIGNTGTEDTMTCIGAAAGPDDIVEICDYQHIPDLPSFMLNFLIHLCLIL